MQVVGIGEEEDGLLKSLDLSIHLVRLDFWLELLQVVTPALAVSCSNNCGGVLANICGDFSPGRLNGGN